MEEKLSSGALAYLYFVTVASGIIFGALVFKLTIKRVAGEEFKTKYAIAFVAVAIG
jgi:hypothetical protein